MANTLWVLKQGDTCPPLAVELYDDHGVALPRPQSITFVMFHNGVLKTEGPAEILESTPKRLWVQFLPDALVLDVTGEWLVEWLLTYPGPHFARAPSGGYDVVRVLTKGSA